MNLRIFGSVDMVAIHNLTFMYVFTGDAAYAAKATQILDAWAVTNTTWGGGENMLDIGDYAPYFITAADILKSTYPGWTADNNRVVIDQVLDSSDRCRLVEFEMRGLRDFGPGNPAVGAVAEPS